MYSIMILRLDRATFTGIEYSIPATSEEIPVIVAGLYSTPDDRAEVATVVAGKYSKFPLVVETLVAILRFKPQICHLSDTFIFCVIDFTYFEIKCQEEAFLDEHSIRN